MRQLQILEPYLMFSKHTHNIPLCCQIFFEFVNKTLRATIPEYQNAKIHDRTKGILLCPNCLIKKLQNTKTQESSTKI